MDMQRTELMPGVWLTTVRAKKFKSSFWSLRLLTPLKRETASLNALLPYVLRRGTARLPDMTALARELDSLYGGVVVPCVEKRGDVQCVGFDASFLDEAYAPDCMGLLEQCAGLMGELLLHPATKNGRLRGDYVKSEQDNLLRAIGAIRNDKMEYARRRLVEEMYAGTDYALSRLGDEAQVKKIHLAKLFGHYQTLLETSGVELYYCGSASHRRVELAWREALMGLPRAFDIYCPETICHREWRDSPRFFSDEMDVQQGKMVLGLTVGFGMEDPMYPAVLVANAMFGGTPDSRLFLHVREKRSLCYNIRSTIDSLKGLIYVSCGVAPEQFDAAREESVTQLGQLQRGEFTQQELESAKHSVINSFRSSMDDQEGLSALRLQACVAGIPFEPERLVQRVAEVTGEQVSAAAMEFVPDSVYTLSGPRGEKGDAT